MRSAMIIPALLLAACNNAGEWRNEQAELANELNPPAPAAPPETLSEETDYLNAASPAGNDANATAPVGNDLNAVENEAVPPPAG